MMRNTNKNYRQRYRSMWETDPRFEGWLQPVEGDDTQARCSCCGSIMQAHLRSLLGHCEGKKHKNIQKGLKQHGISRQEIPVSDRVEQPVIHDTTSPQIENSGEKPREGLSFHSSASPVLDVRNPTVKQQEDFCSSFGKTVEHWMRSLPLEKQRIAAVRIFSLLHEITGQTTVNNITDLNPELNNGE